jgi:predicted amidohydrolase YtcJ
MNGGSTVNARIDARAAKDRSMRSLWRLLRLGGLSVLATLWMACGGGSDGSAKPAATADTIYVNAQIETMDTRHPVAKALAIEGTEIISVGSNSAVLRHQGPATVVTDLHGATILPGFIDAHSHLMGYAFLSDTKYWTDVSSVNLYFKPPPTDSRCKNPLDFQQCFIPVKTEDEAIARITSAAAASRINGVNAVYAANYDPARLGHSSECSEPVTNVGFQCPNLEDGQARAHLDAIASDIPIFVTSEAGHVTFANSPALAKLNICGTDVSNPATCHTPTTNPVQEEALAQIGQLDEDLSFGSIDFFVGEILKADRAGVVADVARAVDLYAQHGYTLSQEGAAGIFQVKLYLDAIKVDGKFPLTAAIVMYDSGSANFADTIAIGQQAQRLISGNPDIFIAALKSFADGSPQEYTAFLSEPYRSVFSPFTGSIFPQPYAGLPDLAGQEMAARVIAAHNAGFAMYIHQNGDQSIIDSVQALQTARMAEPTSKFRDLVLHAPLIDAASLKIVKELEDPISFLMDDLYFWGLPVCQQIIGSELTTQTHALYPAAIAENAGLRVTLHSDTPVSPPDPLFEIWIAKTRKAQQPSWYPNLDTGQCPPMMSPTESISIANGIRGFTTNAACQYGLEKELGTIAPGFTADLVFLSDDPLSMESDPDALRTIRVLGTVHHGTFIANPKANETPIWPE